MPEYRLVDAAGACKGLRGTIGAEVTCKVRKRNGKIFATHGTKIFPAPSITGRRNEEPRAGTEVSTMDIRWLINRARPVGFTGR